MWSPFTASHHNGVDYNKLHARLRMQWPQQSSLFRLLKLRQLYSNMPSTVQRRRSHLHHIAHRSHCHVYVQKKYTLITPNISVCLQRINDEP